MRNTCYSLEKDFFTTKKEYDHTAKTFSTSTGIINVMSYQRIPILSSCDSAFDLRLQEKCNLVVKNSSPILIEPDPNLASGSNDIGPDGV